MIRSTTNFAVRPTPTDTLRFLLYSPDSFGLGHLRRTLTLAGAITRAMPTAACLVATGSACATHFDLPPRVDLVKLPAITKDEEGSYVARTLPFTREQTIGLRRALLLETYRAFRPQLVLVDHHPLGLGGELDALLAEARRDGTKAVLGLRDIIDAPEAVAREWSAPAIRHALAELYDEVLVYGVPEVFDTRIEYPIPPELRERVEFVGYIVRDAGAPSLRALPQVRPRVLVTLGGGQDGAERVQTYLEALREQRVCWDSTIVLGPLMDPKIARTLAREARFIEGADVHTYCNDMPRRLAESQVVVGMAGYNTTCEILRHHCASVLLPRTFPRREQAIRAERLESIGLTRSLERPEPSQLLTAIGEALERKIDWTRAPNLDGATAVVLRLEVLLGVADAVFGRERTA